MDTRIEPIPDWNPDDDEPTGAAAAIGVVATLVMFACIGSMIVWMAWLSQLPK